MRKITGKQQRFVEEYLIDLNATQAAIRAGYSAKRADVIGYENLRKPVIKQAIDREQEARSKRTQITQDKVLTDIELIKADAMKTKFDADGNEVMNNHGAALKACELQGRHLKMFTDKVENTVSVNPADLLSTLQAAAKKAKA